MGFKVKALGFKGLAFRVWSLGFRNMGLRFRI